MIIHLKIVLFSIICFEIVRFLKINFYLREVLNLYKKLFNLFLSKTSDHHKEKTILKYAKLLIFNSFKIILPIIFILLAYLLISNFDNNFSDFILTTKGIIETFFVLIIYYYLRKFLNEKL